MKITYDPAKRAATLRERGLDFRDAAKVFAGRVVSIEDRRFDYGEVRFASYGYLGRRLVNIVWTPRGNSRRVISMRYCSEKEAKAFKANLD